MSHYCDVTWNGRSLGPDTIQDFQDGTHPLLKRSERYGRVLAGQVEDGRADPHDMSISEIAIRARRLLCLSRPPFASKPRGNAVTSELQIEANRRNARLSTGPRTPRGKTAIQFKKLKHGLAAQHITL